VPASGEYRLSKEKVRVYQLARELGVDSKELVDLCKTQGFDVKSHVSALDPEQKDLLVELLKKGHAPAAVKPVVQAASAVSSTPTAPQKPVAVVTRLRNLSAPTVKEKAPAEDGKTQSLPEDAKVTLGTEDASESMASVSPVTQPFGVVPPVPTAKKPAAVPKSEDKAPNESPQTDLEAAVRPVAQGAAVLMPPKPLVTGPRPMTNLNAPRPAALRPDGVTPPLPGAVVPKHEVSLNPPQVTIAPDLAPPKSTSFVAGSLVSAAPQGLRPPVPPMQRPGGNMPPRPGQPGMGNRPRGLDRGAMPPPGAGHPGSGADALRRMRERMPQSQRPPGPSGPGGPVGPGGPRQGGPMGSGPGANRGPAPAPPGPTGPRKIADIPKDLIQGGVYKLDDIARATLARATVGIVTTPAAPVDDEEDAKGKGKGGAKKPGGVVGRADRHKERSDRQVRRKVDEALLDMTGEGTSAARARLRRHKKQRGSMPRKGNVPIGLPITIRSLSEALGVKSAELLMKLMTQGMGTGKTINSQVESELAESIALEYGVELDIKQKLDAEDNLLAAMQKPEDETKLKSRAPVVTIMGHVDHGKTSLLDCIRKSKVVDTEAGGITQVIRAWRVDIHGKPITFLDTPGHEAFTKMRARGANVTDIVVIVVAADDGVMPQTEEAINHAKAADVKIVVAINKVDLPNANIRRTEQQLYGMSLIPDSMGGDVQFIQTSAHTGQGIDELLETLALVAEVEELKANPDKAAAGVCLEAHISEGQGVIATIIVQEGTLKRGDIVLCGAAYGRVRAMYDDHNRQIQEAGPSMPVRLLGLDEVPQADDPFMVVPGLSAARDISEKRKQKALEAAQFRRQTLSFDNLGIGPIGELKVILKADFRGSLEAIRKEIEKLHHEEVKIRVLHTGVGSITEGDIQLALTSPNDTMVIGFNAEPDNRALALADERGIKIHTYAIIYKLTEDVKSALEGRLKPKEEVIRLGRAVIREVFKVTHVGAIAGCVVTQGIIERSAKVRVIRSGVVIFPPAERTVGLDSLKRFKDDVREVREGYECGMKIAGYDDIKIDDVIEAFKIEKILRKLD